MTNVQPRRLPRRDFLLLPLIVVGTFAFLMVCGEFSARLLWPERTDVSCAVHDAATGERFQPNCVATTKAAEGPWVENRFNDCGYRTAESCRLRGAEQLRAIVMGSSISRGALVPYTDTFAARASATLSRLCTRLVDFQNLGTDWGDLATLDHRIPEALALDPKAIIIAVGAFDLIHMSEAVEPVKHTQQLTLHDVVALLKQNTRIFIVAQHYLYRDVSAQISAFLRNGSDSSSYVDAPLPPIWHQRIDFLGGVLARITAQTRAAGVPVVLLYVPDRAQAALEIPRFAHPGLNPLGLGEALRQVALAQGAEFADLTPDFAAAQDFASLYYQADGHPSAGGHRIIGRRVVNILLQDPAFAECRANAQMAGRREP